MLKSPLITGTPEHHDRRPRAGRVLRPAIRAPSCSATAATRSTTSASTAWDYIRDLESPGEFSETEDVRKLSPFPLALDGRGRISPVTPGCQTFITVIEADGTRSKSEYVARYNGKPQLRFAPFYGHNTGTRAVGCAECHGNPAFLGFGQHVLERGSLRGTLLCEKNPKKPLDGFLAMERGRVVAHAAISREGGRPLVARRGAPRVRREPVSGLPRLGQRSDLPLEGGLPCTGRFAASPPAVC